MLAGVNLSLGNDIVEHDIKNSGEKNAHADEVQFDALFENALDF